MTPSLPVQVFRWSSFPRGSDKHNVPSLISLLLEHRKLSVTCRVVKTASWHTDLQSRVCNNSFDILVQEIEFFFFFFFLARYCVET